MWRRSNDKAFNGIEGSLMDGGRWVPVLVPVYLTAGKGSVAGFDKLSISNIQADQMNQFWIVILVIIILDIYFYRILNIEFQKCWDLDKCFYMIIPKC